MYSCNPVDCSNSFVDYGNNLVAILYAANIMMDGIVTPSIIYLKFNNSNIIISAALTAVLR